MTHTTTDNLTQTPAQAATISSSYPSDSLEVAHFLSEYDAAAQEESLSTLRYKIGYVVSFIVQGLFYPFFYFFYYTFFDLHISGKEKLQGVKSPIIFISNHIGFYDSFIFDLFIPPFTAVPPFRFMGTLDVDPFYLKIAKYTGLLSLVYLLFGVVKVTYGQGAEKAIIPATNIIKHGGTMAIFPEGRIWVQKDKDTPIGPFKWGAAILARKTGATVIPVSFRKSGVRFFRDKLVVRIGEPYHVDTAESPEELADDMRVKVLELYNREL